MVLSLLIRIFADGVETIINVEMTKRGETNTEKFQDDSMAAEPIGLLSTQDFEQAIYNIDVWPGMPLVGPETMEEMSIRIDEAEQEMDMQGGMLWEDFKKMLKNRRSPSYAI